MAQFQSKIRIDTIKKNSRKVEYEEIKAQKENSKFENIKNRA